MSTKISHGRGGAANIREDDTPYADGEIVREGAVGDQGDGIYSSGRGGTGNIGGEGTTKAAGVPHDEEIVPETAMKLTQEESHHVGRGGAGNERHVHQETMKQHGFDKKVPHESLIDKAKNLFGKKDKEDKK